MNISFTEYLNEQLLNESGLSTQKVTIDYLNEHCSKALWMAQKKNPICRGDYSMVGELRQQGMLLVDTLKTTRKSINTKNYYTLIFDYIFSTSMTQFPLRSKSIICSTNALTALNYGVLFFVIPTDNAKIGFVNDNDIWNSNAPNLKSSMIRSDLPELNVAFSKCKIQQRISSIKNWFNSTSYDGLNKDIAEELHKLFPSFDKLIDYYKQIITSNFKTYTSANVPVSGDHELWISGDVVLIDGSFWREHIKLGSDVTKWELK